MLITDSLLLCFFFFFFFLSRCLEVEESLRVQLEYTQQLLLSSLLHICSYLTTLGLDTARGLQINNTIFSWGIIIIIENIHHADLLVESQFNMELVVQCIRLSQNPQTHHHALLLLSTAATIFPVSFSLPLSLSSLPFLSLPLVVHANSLLSAHTTSYAKNRVLHNIMPIFTFMGAHLLHQDDQYSFQVITKTIDTVIPPLITVSTCPRVGCIYWGMEIILHFCFLCMWGKWVLVGMGYFLYLFYVFVPLDVDF